MKLGIVALGVLCLLASALPARAQNYFVQTTSVTSSVGIVATAAVHGSPVSHFSLQVKGQGAAPSSWNVALEGSLDGISFSKIMDHSNGDTPNDADGDVKASTSPASGYFPVNYIRVNVKALSLGSSTGIKVQAVGTQ